MARARSGLAPPAWARRPRFVEALLFDVVYKNPVWSSQLSSSATFTLTHIPPLPSLPPGLRGASLPRLGLHIGLTSLPTAATQLSAAANRHRARWHTSSSCDSPSPDSSTDRAWLADTIYREGES
jgi:hypothetical protein